MDIIKEIYLSNHEDFVKVNDLYYGGNQRWLYTENLRLKFWAKRACGVTASANALCHMAIYRHGFERLYRYPSLSRIDFTKFTDELYEYVKPAIYGIPSLRKIDKGVLAFAKERNININSRSLSMPRDRDETIEFIKNGLIEDSPVLMLTWYSKVENLSYHWVTITGYYKTAEDKNYIITSNWGKKEIYSLDDWLKEMSIYRGLIYFY